MTENKEIEKQKKTRLELLEEKKKQLENRISALKRSEKEKERKARTQRLIKIGALAETYFDVHDAREAESRFKEITCQLSL